MAYTIHTHETSLQIQSLTGLNNKVLVGTTDGQLLMFQTNITQDDKVDFILLNKQNFGENILQIEIQSVGTDELLLSLTNNAMQIHRIAGDVYDIHMFNH